MVQETLAAQEEEDPGVRKEKKLEKKADFAKQNFLLWEAFLCPLFCYTPTPPTKKNPNTKAPALLHALIKHR